MNKKVWLDCDTGNDDAFAIILAGFNPKIDLIGISTVFGNNSVDTTAKNSCKIVSLAGLPKVEVYKGASRPLLRPADLKEGMMFHGEHGLGKGVFVPEPDYEAEKESAIVKMYNTFKNSSEKIHICATGALTNIALLFSTFPDVG